MEEELIVEEKKPLYKNRFVIGVGVIGVVLFVILFTFLFRQRTKLSFVPTPTPTVTVKPPTEAAKTEVNQPQSPPDVYFEEYQNKAGIPRVPETVNTYTFKTNYTLEEALEFGRKLGLDKHILIDPFVILFQSEDSHRLGIMLFNKKSGEFSFSSFGFYREPTILKDPRIIAKTFLENIGIADKTVDCQITYKRRSLPGATFVECHRSWEKVGLPIFNTPGIVQLPEEKSLASLKQGEAVEALPDAEIFAVSNGKNGKKRPDDFNTATVIVSEKGEVMYIHSNLRKIEKVVRIRRNQLLSPEEALSRIYRHQSDLALTLPAGEGVIDFSKVYQQNQARGKRAVITDYELVYLEHPSQINQAALLPNYLVKGVAKLKTGYNVRFIEIVSALERTSRFTEVEKKSQNGNGAGLASNLHQRSIQFKNFTPRISANEKKNNFCIPEQWAKIGLEKLTIWRWNVDITDNMIGNTGTLRLGVGRMENHLYFYYFPSEDVVIKNTQVVNRKLRNIMSSIAGIAEKFAETENYGNLGYNKALINDVGRYFLAPTTQSGCPSRIIVASTDSPLIYLYPEMNTEIDVKLGGSVVYADPPFTTALHSIVVNPRWEIIAYPDGSLMTGSTVRGVHSTSAKASVDKSGHLGGGTFRSRLYYEYDKNKVSFTGPKEGFVIESNKWEEFIRETLSPRLGLNQKETEGLVVEVRNAISQVESGKLRVENENRQYWKVSFIDKNEIDKNLPVKITPKPNNFYRIHLMLTPLNHRQKTDKPVITPLPRNGFTVVELGAVIQE